MKFEPQRMQKIPLRYRLIALGFMKKENLEQVNDRLLNQGCMPLYARSYLEASLIYAFSHGLSYEKWQELLMVCEKIQSKGKEQGEFFQGTTISYAELKKYVLGNSDCEQEQLYTRELTQLLEEQISQMSDDEQAFQKYFEDNRNCFSGVREKTRYYFCKYLYYYLTEKMEDFVSLAERRVPRGDDFDLLKGLKGITPLKRKQKSPEETRKWLEGCDVSCGEVFEEFNHFYFDYISNDWVEILSECLVDVSELTRHKQQLIEQREEQDEKKKNRLGETMIRRFIKGNLDIDRSTLISMLLFFSDAFKDETRGIDRQRLDLILDKCGFSMLRAKDDFDSFVIGYMQAEEREEYLMNEATKQALNGENFYLYHVYQGAESQAKLLRKYLK